MRRVIRSIPIALAALSACRPPAIAPSPAGVVGRPRAAALPEPGVYVLRRAKGLTLPADVKPSAPDNFFERVLAGWLYLTPDSIYKTTICADLVDSAGRVPNTLDGGPSDGRYCGPRAVWFTSASWLRMGHSITLPCESTRIRWSSFVTYMSATGR